MITWILAGATVVPLAAFLWACWRNARQHLQHPDVRAAEWHHLYLGILLAAGGGLLDRWWLAALGLVCAVDDAYQHVRQVTGAPFYDSPLHRLWSWIYAHSPIAQWVNRQLDRLFGATR